MTADEPVPAVAESAPVPERFRGPPRRLRRPVRPAAVADREAPARRHPRRARAGHRRVPRAHPAREGDWDLDQASGFLVVAATLLDLKVARLLPAPRSTTRRTSPCSRPATCSSRACCSTAPTSSSRARLGDRFAARVRRIPRRSDWSPRSRRCCPRSCSGSPGRVRRARRARDDAPARPVVAIEHLHAPKVSVRRAGRDAGAAAARGGAATFRGLTADADATLVVVARFLALLELYREGRRGVRPGHALGELHVRWVGGRGAEAELDRWAHESGEPDEYDGAPPANRPRMHN